MHTDPHREIINDSRKQKSKYRRARVRHFLFTIGPNRLTGGRIVNRHLRSDLEVNQIELSSPRWPKEFDGLRIGHVSDFHLGELLPLDKALAAVELLAEQEPDFVACTGDVVDLDHHEAKPLLEALAGVDAPLGSAMVLGNHDELHCGRTLSQMAMDAGLLLLHNDVARINCNGNVLTVAGLGWARTAPQCSELVDITCYGEHVDLLLSHNPKAFPRAIDYQVPLTLAGHTHGGQVAMKSRPNTNLSISHRMSAGAFEQDESRLYVTTGIGAWFPLRVNCPAEIAIITMRHEAA